MLIAFLLKDGTVELRDSDETPVAYILGIEERAQVARTQAELAKVRGANNKMHVAMNPLARPDVRGVGQEAAIRALFDHLSKHPKFARYALQQFSIEAANAANIAVDAGKAKDAAAPVIVSP